MTNKTREVVEKLLKKTSQKGVEWTSISSGGDESYMCSLGTGSIIIEKITFGRDTTYSCKIINGSTILENFYTTEADSPDFSLMEHLFEIVRKQVLKIDDFLDNLSQLLE